MRCEAAADVPLAQRARAPRVLRSTRPRGAGASAARQARRRRAARYKRLRGARIRPRARHPYVSCRRVTLLLAAPLAHRHLVRRQGQVYYLVRSLPKEYYLLGREQPTIPCPALMSRRSLFLLPPALAPASVSGAGLFERRVPCNATS